MEFNTELANQALDYIREHPDEWNQDNWTKCFAGIVLRLKGYLVSDNSSLIYDDRGKYLGTIRYLAAKELGFENPFALPGELFSFRNTIEDLEEQVRRLSESQD